MSGEPQKKAMWQQSDVDLLADAVRSLRAWRRGDCPKGFAHGIFLNGPTFVSISHAGAAAIRHLARRLLAQRTELQDQATPEAVVKMLMDMVLRGFSPMAGEDVSLDDLSELEHALEERLGALLEDAVYVVPCAILAARAAPFSIGGVRFLHVSNFAGSDVGLAPDDPTLAAVLEPTRMALDSHPASWLAIVEVKGCEQKRAIEVADLAVDIALAGLKLVVRLEHGRLMARLTGKTMPTFRGCVSVTRGGALRGDIRNIEPGRLLPGDEFSDVLGSRAEELESIGRRVDAYLTGTDRLSRLEQAWSDAAYWFHEGLSETLDTVAITKLETSMECLFRAESAKGSRKRIRRGLELLLGMEDESEVQRIAAQVVEARSRVLHGTWSTTRRPPAESVSRSTVEALCHAFLLRYATSLDDYADSVVDAEDNIDDFLDWFLSVKSQRIDFIE